MAKSPSQLRIHCSAHQWLIRLDLLARGNRNFLKDVGETTTPLLADGRHVALQELRGRDDDEFAVHAESELATLDVEVGCGRTVYAALYARRLDWSVFNGGFVHRE